MRNHFKNIKTFIPKFKKPTRMNYFTIYYDHFKIHAKKIIYLKNAVVEVNENCTWNIERAEGWKKNKVFVMESAFSIVSRCAIIWWAVETKHNWRSNQTGKYPHEHNREPNAGCTFVLCVLDRLCHSNKPGLYTNEKEGELKGVLTAPWKKITFTFIRFYLSMLIATRLSMEEVLQVTSIAM